MPSSSSAWRTSEIGFAGGDDAEARLRRVDDDAVEPVGAGERHRSGELVAVQA
jgi:hypothetical protein